MSVTIGRRPADHFTMIPNSYLRDHRLSLKARGLLGYLLSHSEGYQLTEARILQDITEGRDALRSALAELEDAGYLTRERDYNPRGGSTVNYLLGGPDSGKSTDPNSGFSDLRADLQEQGVSAGQPDGGFSALRTTTEKNKEEEHKTHPPTPSPDVVEGEIVDESPSQELAVPEGVTAQTVVAGWIDYCGAHGVTLTARVIGHWARQIKSVLGTHSPNLVKHAMAKMFEDGQHAYPGLLDKYVIQLQVGERRWPATTQPSPAEVRQEAARQLRDKIAAEEGPAQLHELVRPMTEHEKRRREIFGDTTGSLAAAHLREAMNA